MTRLNSSLFSSVVFAAAGGAAGSKPAPLQPAASAANPANTPAPLSPAPVAGETPAAEPAKPAAAKKPEPVIIGVSTAVVMPDLSARKNGKRGNKVTYDVSALQVGQSLAIKGRKAENLTSTISTANRDDKYATFKTDTNGNPLHAVIENRDANGVVVSTTQGEKLVASRRVFFAYDCDPKTDPEGADVRIFRDHDKIVA